MYMCSDKTENSDKASDIAKNIWLAGLGAYGRAYDVASEKYNAASKDADKLFNDLVEKGVSLEKQTREQFVKPLPKPKVAIEDRIEKMRNYLGFGAPSEEIERLEMKVKTLEEELQVALTELAKKD